ncbi:tyrosine-type recombinase/integrase [Haloarcula marina]|uniref:tyrosine-type recombinase/integrase n=1 Tax=Haloarcula marina TaxID=2961574 RepID=UPI0020B6E234|nr:tyrosine-type recombinase/integrase [Halomicroarcula marina]
MRDTDFRQVLSRVENNKSEATATQYVPKIREFRQWLNYGEPTPEYDGYIREPKVLEEADTIDVEDWLAELDERYTNASSVGKAEASLVAAFNELNKLIDAGRIDAEGWEYDTPAERADYSPEDSSTYKSRQTNEDLEWLTPDEVDTLAKATDKLRDELIVRLLFQTGARVTELCNIRVSDVDREARSVNIRGKGRKNRTVYYQPSLTFLMDVWLDERRPAVYYADESEYLYPTSHSEQITRQTVEEVVREAAKEAGLQSEYGENADGHTLHSVTPHVIRHSFAMAALEEGWDVYTLSQALGHESTEITTSTYLHDDEEKVRNAFRRRGPATDD